MNNQANDTLVREQFLKALGLGAVLTNGNPNKKSLRRLGLMCIKLDHDWTFHQVNLTIAFFNAPISLRNALAFDRQYHMSWAVSEIRDELVTFTATGSLKSWRKMRSRMDDKDWGEEERVWFRKVHEMILPILPRYFGEKA